MGCKASKLCCCCGRGRGKKKSQSQERSREDSNEIPPKLQNDNLQEEAKTEKVELLEQHCGDSDHPQDHQEKGECLSDAPEAEKKLNTLPEQQLSEQNEKLQELQKAHEQEKLLLTDSFQKSQASLQETINQLTAQVNSYEEKVRRAEESVLNKNYKKFIEDYGSPSHFWEQEIESLHFVIETKNVYIRSLEKKLLNLETVMEQNFTLEAKIKTLQQENEDLQARMQNHAGMTRQLSEELLALREALEKETQLKEQAFREREQLLYRAGGATEQRGHPLPFLVT